MSSMLKKAGAGAFKPKAPIARRRPAPNVAAQSAAQPQTTETEPAEAPVQQPTPGPSQHVATASPTAESQQEQPNPPAAANSKKDEPALPSESPRTTVPEAPKSPKSSRVVPATKASPSSKPRESAASLSKTSTEPAAPAQAPTVQASSTQQEEPPRTSQSPADPAASSNHPDAPATASPKPTESGKSNFAGGTKRTPSKTVPKPKPIAEKSAPEDDPARAARSLPTPSADGATSSIENGESPSTTPSFKNANTSRKPAARQPRKRKAATTTCEGEAGAEAEGPPKKKRAPRKKNVTSNGADGEASTEGAENAVAKKRPQRKRKAADYTEQDGQEEEGERGEGDEDLMGSESGEQTETQKSKKKRRKRSVTPEDAENITIDPETITLGQLTRDPRTGKRWDKAALIQASEQERKREKQRQQLIERGLLKEGEELPGGDLSEAGTPAPKSSTPAPEPAAPAPAPAPAGGLRYRVVDGQIVLDDTTLQHDRHAEADEARGDLEAREEHEFSRRTTKYTLMRRKTQGNSWTSQDTERFYDGLRSFGTDFEMISQMFGGAKSRRQVKLKFNREERANPAAVNACLVGEKTVPMTLDAIHGFEDLEESDAIKNELAREREEREAEARREEEERAAENRQKAADLGGRGKKGRDKGRAAAQPEDDAGADEHPAGAAAAALRAKSKQKESVHPGAKYGVGTDPDVIDETDLPTPSTRGGRAGRGRGRGGRRGGMIPFGSGFGA